MKVIPRMEHHICTGDGISNQIYRREQNRIEETGQGNIASGHGYRDSSCFNLKEFEKARKSTVFKASRMKMRVNRISITFMDDINHYSNGNNYQQNMKEIIDLYRKLYEVTIGKISVEKSYVYCWRYDYENGIKVIKNIKCEININ